MDIRISGCSVFYIAVTNSADQKNESPQSKKSLPLSLRKLNSSSSVSMTNETQTGLDVSTVKVEIGVKRKRNADEESQNSDRKIRKMNILAEISDEQSVSSVDIHRFSILKSKFNEGMKKFRFQNFWESHLIFAEIIQFILPSLMVPTNRTEILQLGSQIPRISNSTLISELTLSAREHFANVLQWEGYDWDFVIVILMFSFFFFF